jgi:hypothetical protein
VPMAAPQVRAEPKATAEPLPPPEPMAPAIPSSPVVVLDQSSRAVAEPAFPAAPAPMLGSPEREPEKTSEPLADVEPRAIEVLVSPVADPMAVERSPGPAAAATRAGASHRALAKASGRPRRSSKTTTATTIALLLATLAIVVACLVLNRLWTLYH